MRKAFVAKYGQGIVDGVYFVILLMTPKVSVDELLYIVFGLRHVCQEGYLVLTYLLT